MHELLFAKPVDQSLLKAGLTVPVKKQDLLMKSIGVTLKKGQKIEILVAIDGTYYEAGLTYVDLSEKYSNREVVQIRYAENSPISRALKQIFSYSGRTLVESKPSVDGDEQLTLTTKGEEHIEVYALDESTIEFKCFPKSSASDLLSYTGNGIEHQTASFGKEPLRGIFEKVLNNYNDAKKQAFTKHPMGDFVRNEIPKLLYETGLINSQTHIIRSSVGQTKWANVPWICVFDRNITTTAQKGVYIVYLFAKDGNSLYLTLNQGCTEILKNNTRAQTISIMRKMATSIQKKLNARGFCTDEKISLEENSTGLAELYQRGTIFYKEYKKNALPSETELREDLANMMRIYNDYVTYEKTGSVQDDGGEKELSTKEAILAIKDYIAFKGFTFEEGMIENIYLSLKSKPFVILAGTSGTGKTRLIKYFAEAIGATSGNGRYKMVAVRPDWSDSSDLFGHVDLNGNFIPGTIIDFVKQAEIDYAHPYFLCLDEMNLARVEYYLSDILSVMETRENNGFGKIVSDPLIYENYYGADAHAAGKYGRVTLPENLYIVGTVNMDETTFPFSKKVLDRANTIEFSTVDLIPQANGDIKAVKTALDLPNSFLKTEYLLLTHCAVDSDEIGEVCSELQDINKILQKANAQVGYRVRDEIVFYMLNNKAKLLSRDVAMDYEIMQKILPRIQGSSASVKTMLSDLFKHCAGDYEGHQTGFDDIATKMDNAAKIPTCKYKKSAGKIAFMVRRFEEDGFTSYWL